MVPQSHPPPYHTVAMLPPDLLPESHQYPSLMRTANVPAQYPLSRLNELKPENWELEVRHSFRLSTLRQVRSDVRQHQDDDSEQHPLSFRAHRPEYPYRARK